MKKKLFLAVCIIMLFTLLAFSAAAKDVKVTIPEYYTEVDYMSVANEYVEYPLLNYNGVTYLPLTYHLCEKLKFAVNFDAKEGLFLAKALLIDTFYEEKPLYFGNYTYNTKKSYKAKVADYPVYINGIRYDAKSSGYPFLNFRGVTYLPLTYDLAYLELGCNIEWNEKEQTFKATFEKNTGRWYFADEDETGLYLDEQIGVYSQKLDMKGNIVYHHEFSYYDNYKIDFATGDLVRLEQTMSKPLHSSSGKHIIESDGYVPLMPKADGLYYNDERILELTQQVSTISKCTKYVQDDGTVFMLLSVQYGNAPAPYTTYYRYMYMEKDGVVTPIPEWKDYFNFNIYHGITPDSLGGYYLYSGGNSPTHASRWSNVCGSIIHISADGKVTDINGLYEDFGSLSIIGHHENKLYVVAEWYPEPLRINQDRQINAARDGIYYIEDGSFKLEKLYPYFYGNHYMTKNGDIYSIPMFGMRDRIINVKTGKVITAD